MHMTIATEPLSPEASDLKRRVDMLVDTERDLRERRGRTR
jgi:hypothetical protein